MSTPATDLDVDPHELLLKSRELALLRQKLALVKECGISFYRPHEKQHEFHSSCAKRRGFFAGNRTGKSECDAAETVAWMVGERTWYKYVFPIYGMRDGRRVMVSFHEGHENHPLVRSGIPRYATKQLIITTDWKKVDEIWTSPRGDSPGKLWKFIPSELECTFKRNHEGIIDQIFAKNGAVIRFTTEQAYLKNPQSSESTDYDRVAIDEPVVEDMWKANARSLVDRDGQGDFTLTSLRERWIYDYFTDPDNVREDRFSVRATIYDNPYLSPAAIQRFSDELTDDEKECRLLGIPLELSGLVYKEFKRETHVLSQLPKDWTSWACPPLDHTIYLSIDVHSQTPQAVMFVAVGPTGRPIVYDEIWRPCTADELAAEILLRLAGRQVGFAKCDPRAWDEDPVYRVSMAQRFQANGLNIEKASKALTFGITNMKQVLKTEGVHFAPTVKRTLWEMARWHYDKENKPVDKDDHFMECMYRIFINLSNLVYIPLTISRPVRDFTVDMTVNVLRDFNRDQSKFDRATAGLN